MNKIFNVYNKSGRVGWFVAESKERVLELALERRHARKLENLSAEEVNPESLRRDGHNREYEGWETMLEGPEGQASLILPAMRMADLFDAVKQGNKPPESEVGRWQVT
ncbi:MAG TPA: hypothetical protein VJ742_12785 [Nitrososphaera sp.]|nr:hypothetical protein [Nitrososphaera sp.]